MHIRRDRSGLHFGRPGGQRGSALLVIWLVIMVLTLGVIWRFERVQEWVLAGIGGDSTPTPDAITLARQGERAYLDGDLERAVQLYTQAVQQQPDDLDITFETVRMLVYRSYAGERYHLQAAEALAVAERMVEIAPDDARAQAAWSLALQENDRVQAAISAGLTAIELAPEFGEAWAYLALAYYQDNRPNQAFDAADKAVTYAPNSLDAHRALALCLNFKGQPDAAIQQYEQAIQLHPHLDVLYFELAWTYLGQQNYEAAIAAYDRVLAREPANVKAYTRKCYTYFVIGEFAQAEEACDQAVMLDRTYPEAYQWLGKVRYKRRNFEGTVEALAMCTDLQAAQGIPLADRQIDCYYIRALALAYLADCDAAWPLFLDALQMAPSEDIQRAITDGQMLCARYEPAYSVDDIPTPAPTPTPIPELIEIY